MTQKELVLQELTRSQAGLTTVELHPLTGIPEASLRTIVWEMRKDGWVEPVGGVRGRFKYGITDAGLRQAPRPFDAIAEAFSRARGMDFGSPSARVPTLQTPPNAVHHLLAFVRWLRSERPHLLREDAGDTGTDLEAAVIDYAYGGADAIRALLDQLGASDQE